MKDFLETAKFKILLLILVFLLGIMTYAGASGRLTAAPQEILGLLITPLQSAAAYVERTVAAWTGNITHFYEIIEENEKLREENAQLKNQLVEYDILKAENEAYKQLQNIQESNPEHTFLSGFVIGRDSLAGFYGFSVNIGSLNGVTVGDTVISDEGYLVGYVQEVGLTNCKVMTILHPSFAVACRVSETGDNGIFCGDAAAAENLQGIMTNLVRDNKIRQGDQVVTTGLGENFPAEILVGKIFSLQVESSGKSSRAIVQPYADITALTHIFVVTD